MKIEEMEKEIASLMYIAEEKMFDELEEDTIRKEIYGLTGQISTSVSWKGKNILVMIANNSEKTND